jgi:thiamine biosynthesis lipoprotein
MTQRVRPHFGTFVSIEAEAENEAAGLAAIDAAFERVDEVGRLLHPKRGTDLRRLREARSGDRVTVEAWTYEILSVCRQLSSESGGVFDPCLPERSGRMRDIELLENGQVLKRAEAELDLGGIAKGFAVDRAIEALRELGCRSGLVNAGGDLRIFGREAREVLLRLPSGRVLRHALREEAIAASEPKTDRSPPEHRGFYIGDTREAVAGRWSAVTAPTATLADGLSKCAMLCAPELAAALLVRYRGRLLLADGSSHRSDVTGG